MIQSMITAPRDGTPVLLCGFDLSVTEIGRWDAEESRWYALDFDEIDSQVEHYTGQVEPNDGQWVGWVPLPDYFFDALLKTNWFKPPRAESE